MSRLFLEWVLIGDTLILLERNGWKIRGLLGRLTPIVRELGFGWVF